MLIYALMYIIKESSVRNALKAEKKLEAVGINIYA
jgi:hypothetical protein